VLPAVRLLGCDHAHFLRPGESTFLPVAIARPNGLRTAFHTEPVPIDPDANFPSRVMVTRKALHLPDWSKIELPPFEQRTQQLHGTKSSLLLPMLRDEKCIGVLAISSKRANHFNDHDVALAESFRDQALIAIENARLFNETKEALERQTVIAEVLEVINASSGDLNRVFDIMLKRAMRLCEAAFGGFTSYDGKRFHTLALRGLPPKVARAFGEPWTAGPGSYHENLVQGESLVHTDLLKLDDAARRAHPQSSAVSEIGGARTGLFVALRKEEKLVGSLWFYRKEVRPFSDEQIALVQNFAAQSVIAMENARLLNELRQRTNDLGESLQQQTATADVLKVISRSTVELKAVLAALLETATHLCHADHAYMFRR